MTSLGKNGSEAERARKINERNGEGEEREMKSKRSIKGRNYKNFLPLSPQSHV